MRMTGTLQLAQQFGNGAKTIKQGDLTHIEVKMDAQESAMKYEIKYKRYSTTILEYRSAQ